MDFQSGACMPPVSGILLPASMAEVLLCVHILQPIQTNILLMGNV